MWRGICKFFPIFRGILPRRLPGFSKGKNNSQKSIISKKWTRPFWGTGFSVPELCELESACRVSSSRGAATVRTVCFSGGFPAVAGKGCQQQFATQTLRFPEFPSVDLRNSFRRVLKSGFRQAILARFCFSVRFTPSGTQSTVAGLRFQPVLLS